MIYMSWKSLSSEGEQGVVGNARAPHQFTKNSYLNFSVCQSNNSQPDLSVITNHKIGLYHWNYSRYKLLKLYLLDRQDSFYF